MSAFTYFRVLTVCLAALACCGCQYVSATDPQTGFSVTAAGLFTTPEIAKASRVTPTSSVLIEGYRRTGDVESIKAMLDGVAGVTGAAVKAAVKP